MKKLLFIGAAALVLTTACKKDSSEIDQQKIFQSYEMSYNAVTNKTTVKAHFSEDDASGKTIELSSGSSVTFNGNPLSFGGGDYSATFDGQIGTAAFLFTDLDGKSYENNLSHANSIGNSSSNGTWVDKNQSIYWYFAGTSLGTGETAGVTFTCNDPSNPVSAAFTNSSSGATSVTLTLDKLSSMPDGYATCAMNRTKVSSNGNFAAVGGRITTKYIGLEATVQFY